MTAQSKESDFDKLIGKLQFDIFSGHPESSIVSFLKRYFPYLTRPYKPGGWTIYPSEPPPIPKYGSHSIRLKKHPYVDFNFKEVELEIETQEWPKGNPGIQTVLVWFYFNTLKEGQNGFNNLISMFEPISTSKNIKKEGGKQRATFKQKRNDELELWSTINLFLFKDELGREYKLLLKYSLELDET